MTESGDVASCWQPRDGVRAFELRAKKKLNSRDDAPLIPKTPEKSNRENGASRVQTASYPHPGPGVSTREQAGRRLHTVTSCWVFM